MKIKPGERGERADRNDYYRCWPRVGQLLETLGRIPGVEPSPQSANALIAGGVFPRARARERANSARSKILGADSYVLRTPLEKITAIPIKGSMKITCSRVYDRSVRIRSGSQAGLNGETGLSPAARRRLHLHLLARAWRCSFRIFLFFPPPLSLSLSLSLFLSFSLLFLLLSFCP